MPSHTQAGPATSLRSLATTHDKPMLPSLVWKTNANGYFRQRCPNTTTQAEEPNLNNEAAPTSACAYGPVADELADIIIYPFVYRWTPSLAQKRLQGINSTEKKRV